ncbi:hydroxyethylthiazole kinase [Oxalobacter vibrioformis]|uniref:Hydroxyethylthiazole kinase n=1 Tax=Oxalobacter vibrioformis TaxID=933080 RepID=A0A9E9LXD3_9BURK|nr:hydroxyethylthiazole kinase [Oxalobacter vibrioformis]WAW09340.1 hydroxyethylthiazole kinase [Oxalobacter vibrioformis]
MTSAPHTLSVEDLWHDVTAVRENRPLVHNITNYVVAPYNANALLALGASPVMAHAHEEAGEMAQLASALVLNIGTLDPYWVTAMKHAMAAANEAGKPVVLDPVGAGATAYRTETVHELIRLGPPAIIRGNASEILSLAGYTAPTKGVDSAATSGTAVTAARMLAERINGTVCISGADDHVVDSVGRWLSLSNGHEWMTRITGTGCSASAMVGAFAAIQPDRWRATAAAMAYLGVAGEIAAEEAIKAGCGVGSLQMRLLDRLQLLSRQDFISRLKITHHS